MRARTKEEFVMKKIGVKKVSRAAAKLMLFCVMGCLMGCLALQAQNAAPAGSAENGKKLWVKDNCYTCHGYDGHGGAGVRITPKPIAVNAFIAFVRHPAKSNMPTFTAKIISDSELRDMWTYLNSIPANPAVQDIPLLTALP
jgi:ubiquinol-cytochrome c reductase cytochrome c subunit